MEFVQTGSIKDTCKKTGIVKQTYYNWLNNPNFKREIKEQQENHYESSLSSMKNLFALAVETHEELLKSDSESIRLRAANAIINKNGRILEAIELRERLKNLEKKAREKESLTTLEEKCNELESNVEQEKN
ncbi:MAG: hypothetical protein A2Y25_04620 [Candidatus Melainabacteria bacterium GWF2_37_15]|nr:MAG: hypothetical protein A2Y25_04620 [Candidatus Melainabacteria bacterium GWF2_37_15]